MTRRFYNCHPVHDGKARRPITIGRRRPPGSIASRVAFGLLGCAMAVLALQAAGWI